MILYHLDRFGSLVLGSSIDFLPEAAIPPKCRESELLKLFDFKISGQGWNQLSDRVPYIKGGVSPDGSPTILVDSFISQKNTTDQKIMELVFELVRRSCFPTHPSRFTSLFTVKEVSDFQLWPELYDKNLYPNTRLYKIDSPDNTPKFDANLLRGGVIFGNESKDYYMGYLPLAAFDFAYRYWSGSATETPRWEYLVSLPVAEHCISEAHCSF